MTKLHVDDRGIGVCFSGGVKEFLSFPKCFNRPWDLASFQYGGYLRLFHWKYSSRGMELTTDVSVVPTIRMLGAMPPFRHMSVWRGA